MEKAKDNNEKNEFSILLSSNFMGLQNNQILDHFLPLLLLAFRLSKLEQLNSTFIAEIREKFINEILTISSKLSALKLYDDKEMIKLRYCLSVFIDEMLMKNELFINSSWANNSLTVRLFNETLGGDKFYDIVGNWLLSPTNHKDMLEFIYACLVLGYEGKYANDKSKNEKIIYLCENIAASITPVIGSDEEIAFKKAYKSSKKDNFFDRLRKRYLKNFYIALPLTLIVLIYAYTFFNIQTINIKTENNLSYIIKKFSDAKE